MAYTDKYGTFFARAVDRSMGDFVVILHVEDGTPATRLDASVYPVGSETSAKYEHPEGIVLHAHDAVELGIELEA